jgi:hypothetical protein
MRLWTTRTVDAPAEEAWAILTDLDRWPDWGPSVTGAELDAPGRFETGATGRVRTVAGPPLPFVLTDVRPGEAWSWRVAGVPATRHRVEPRGEGWCRVGFGVPVWAPPYLVVCAVALRRIERLLDDGTLSGRRRPADER